MTQGTCTMHVHLEDAGATCTYRLKYQNRSCSCGFWPLSMTGGCRWESSAFSVFFLSKSLECHHSVVSAMSELMTAFLLGQWKENSGLHCHDNNTLIRFEALYTTYIAERTINNLQNFTTHAWCSGPSFLLNMAYLTLQYSIHTCIHVILPQ